MWTIYYTLIGTYLVDNLFLNDSDFRYEPEKALMSGTINFESILKLEFLMAVCLIRRIDNC